jgi:hypothetical protein
VRAGLALRCRSFLIDGEVVVCGEDGVAVFDRLRSGPRRKPEAMLYAFDLIELDGRDLRREPIEGRKDLLRRLLDVPVPCRGMLLCEHIRGDGPLIFEHVCALGCEGIVSKRRGSRYRSGRSADWVKTKNPSSAAARRARPEKTAAHASVGDGPGIDLNLVEHAAVAIFTTGRHRISEPERLFLLFCAKRLFVNAPHRSRRLGMPNVAEDRF